MTGEANPGSSLRLPRYMLLNIASIMNYAQKLDAVVRPPKHQKVTRPPHNPKLRPGDPGRSPDSLTLRMIAFASRIAARQ